jgi:hypothetical protein
LWFKDSLGKQVHEISILKKLIAKNRAGEVAEDVDPEFKPLYRKKKVCVCVGGLVE